MLGLDIDGVVVDFTHSANLWLAEQTGTPLLPPATWHYYRGYPNGDVLFASLFDTAKQANFWRGLRPVQGAIRGVRSLAKRGDIAFVTHRHEELRGVTEDWMTRHGLGDIPVFYLRGEGGKTSKVAVPHLQVHVDDKPSTVREFLDAGRDAVLFRQPWNHEAWKELPSVRGWANLLMRLCWGSGKLYVNEAV